MVCRDSAHNPIMRTTSHHFLMDARQNLDVVRQLDGWDSMRYRLLIRQYRQVATLLGCRSALEAIVQYQEQGPGQ